MNIGFPDVCLTPAAPSPIPVPYPNIAMNAQAAPFAALVKLTMVNALNMASKIPLTTGDEGGTAHATFKGMGSYTMGNPRVFIEKLPGINLTCPTTGNNMNNPVGAVLVPSATTVFYSLVSSVAPAASSWSADAVRTHRDSVDHADVGCEALEAGVTLLRIPVITQALPSQITRWLETARWSRGLILDLRGNGGGALRGALELAGAFLDEGTTITEVIDHEGDAIAYRARSPALYDGPLAVLVDGGTASAAELVAAALQHSGRARIVGSPTLGKQTIQMFGATDGQVVYGTVATWRAPVSARGTPGPNEPRPGIVPDVAVDEHEDPVSVAVEAVAGASAAT